MVKLSKVVLVGLLLIVFLAGLAVGKYYALSMKPADKPEQYLTEAEQLAPIVELKEEQSLSDFERMAPDLPQNPTLANATCAGTSQVIESSSPTNCVSPVFTWNAGSARIQGTQVSGYNVYWVAKTNDGQDVVNLLPEHPLQSMQFGYNRTSNLTPTMVTAREFTPTTTFQSGNTYYLLVQTITDSLHPLLKFGGVVDPNNPNNIRSAEVLFTYVYQ